ncbi:amidohydrolase family protein [Mangrovivirga cuniculi]|uniref:Amidohydrolase n=1 Tax=Mangrovivirga cuniculi TaxID=2715131 RepID=A0A4D7JLA0_9BACT|nr:amidohydrolase family protein [Mangrovivirga cuniculi]QCK14280.1 amidohydrolase [Mangrovivirga cuniculi]
MKILKKALLGLGGLIVLILIALISILIVDSYQTSFLKLKNQPAAGLNNYMIRNVNIIPMTADTVILNSSVTIKNGLISSIGDTLNRENLAEIDGKGGFLSPGLTDMHVHVWDKYELGLYLANGVTAVRNLWGQPMHLRIKKEVMEGQLIAPLFFTSSPKLTGPQFIGDDNVNLVAPEEAKEKIINYKDRGYDFVKTYYGLTEELFEAILKQADISKMDVVAHPTPEVSYDYHFNSLITTIEHAEEFVQQPLNYQLDTAKLNEIINGYVANPHATLSPTLIVYYNIYNMLQNENILTSEELDYINPLIHAIDSEAQFDRWNSTKQEDSTVTKRIKDQHDFHLLIIKKLYENGVNIVCGTDAGIGITLPGFSIHQELEFYKEAGMSNYEVLKTATINPSKTHAFLTELGSIENGKVANLLLLEENPLDDLKTLQKPNMVFVKGRKINPEQLSLFKEKAKNRNNLIATALRYAEYLIVER